MKLSSEQQDLISHLEQDLARSRIELNERESRINEILRTEVFIVVTKILLVSFFSSLYHFSILLFCRPLYDLKLRS